MFVASERKPWDSNPQTRFTRRLFSSCVQLPRLLPSSSLSLGGTPCFRPGDFRDLQGAGVGIEPTPPGSEPSIATSSDYPAMTMRRMTRSRLRSSQIAGAGIEPSTEAAGRIGQMKAEGDSRIAWGQSPASLPTATTPQRKRDGWDSNPRAGA